MDDDYYNEKNTPKAVRYMIKSQGRLKDICMACEIDGYYEAIDYD
jgi:hypothetical protein